MVTTKLKCKFNVKIMSFANASSCYWNSFRGIGYDGSSSIHSFLACFFVPSLCVYFTWSRFFFRVHERRWRPSLLNIFYETLSRISTFIDDNHICKQNSRHESWSFNSISLPLKFFVYIFLSLSLFLILSFHEIDFLCVL